MGYGSHMCYPSKRWREEKGRHPPETPPPDGDWGETKAFTPRAKSQQKNEQGAGPNWGIPERPWENKPGMTAQELMKHTNFKTAEPKRQRARRTEAMTPPPPSTVRDG